MSLEARKQHLINLINTSILRESDVLVISGEIQRINLRDISGKIIQQVRNELKGQRLIEAMIYIADITREEQSFEQALEAITGHSYYHTEDKNIDLRNLAKVAINVRNFEQARKAIRKIDNRVMAVDQFIEMAAMSHNTQDLEYAINIITPLIIDIDPFSSHSHYGYINDTLPKIVNVAIEIGDMEEARKAAFNIISGYRQTVNFLKIFQVSHDEADLNRARDAALREEYSDAYYGNTQTGAFLEIAKISRDERDINSARDAATKTEGHGHISRQTYCFLSIAMVTGEKSDFERAHAAALKCGDRILFDLARDLINFGNLEQARKVVRDIGDYFLGSLAFIRIAGSSHESQDFEEVLEIISKEKIDWAKSERLLETISAIRIPVPAHS